MVKEFKPPRMIKAKTFAGGEMLGGKDDQPPARNKSPKQTLLERSKQSPMQQRHRLAEDYVHPVTERENWWRAHIRETPGPGAYDSEPLFKELLNRPATYRFRSDGRRHDPMPHMPRGKELMPGAYGHQDFIAANIDKSLATYRFKDTDRTSRDMMNFGKKDKDVNVSPNQYAIDQYLSMSVNKQSSKHWVFKSQAQRFPTVYFVPKDGPSPGLYEYTAPPNPIAVSSSFKSKTPRFATSHTKVPGPGSYEKTFQASQPKTIMKMGRQHGLFFSSAFQA